MVMFLYTLFRIISTLVYLYSVLIVIDALFSWIPSLYNSRVGELIRKLVDPYLSIFERIIPPIGGIGLAPIAALFVLYLINNYALTLIFNLLFRLFIR